MYEGHVPKNYDQQQINNKVGKESFIYKHCWTEFWGHFKSTSPFYSLIGVMSGKHSEMINSAIYDRQARLERLEIQPAL